MCRLLAAPKQPGGRHKRVHRITALHSSLTTQMSSAVSDRWGKLSVLQKQLLDTLRIALNEPMLMQDAGHTTSGTSRAAATKALMLLVKAATAGSAATVGLAPATSVE